jgi:hypothetical protein
MAPRSPRPPPSPIGEWIASLPRLDGVRPVDTLPPPRAVAAVVAGAAGSSVLQRPSYRRQSPPGAATAAAPQQEIYSLVRDGGVLRWRAGTVPATGLRQRAAGRAALPPGQIVKQYAFERLEPSQVHAALLGLDQRLTPAGTGLRRLHNGQLLPFDPRRAAGKKVLLIVHGTFSTAEAVVTEGLQSTPAGLRLLADAARRYDAVLVFDHPTLSVSPMLNAFDLAALLRPAPASIDMVCHSRGGLVARWFCEAFAEPSIKRRVLFVASPLAGTSLAAAPRLKSSLDLLTNTADMLRTLGDSAAAQPLFLAASGLMRVLSAVTGGAARAPILDAAIALIPGLDGQSRVGNNQELLRLRANTGAADFASGQVRYFSVQANFEPRDIGWNFLRLFSKPMQRLGDWGADLVFQGPNDLIVDTASMAETADGRPVTIAHDFGTTDRVHHTNYFVQPETIRAVRSSFGLALA